MVRDAGGFPLLSQKLVIVPGDGIASVTGTKLASNQNGNNNAIQVRQIPAPTADLSGVSSRNTMLTGVCRTMSVLVMASVGERIRIRTHGIIPRVPATFHPTSILEWTVVTPSLQYEIDRAKHVQGSRAPTGLDCATYAKLSMNVTWTTFRLN